MAITKRDRSKTCGGAEFLTTLVSLKLKLKVERVK